MPLFVNLYWGGRMVNAPFSGISYSPARATGYIILSEMVSYDEFLSMICQRIGIDVNEYKVVIYWRHAVVAIAAINSFTFITTPVDEGNLSYVFTQSWELGQLELIIEYEMLTQQRFQRTATYEAGPSRRDEERSIPYDHNVNTEQGDYGMSPQMNVRGVELSHHSGEDNARIPEDDADDSNDSTYSVGSDFYSPGDEGGDSGDDAVFEFSSESGGDSGEDAVFGLAKPYVPAVRGEQPVPVYERDGSEYFRSLPSDVGGYRAYHAGGGDAENIWYWDDSNPTHIGLGTKFDSKLHMKTAVTLWHLQNMRQFAVTQSKKKDGMLNANFLSGWQAVKVVLNVSGRLVRH